MHWNHQAIKKCLLAFLLSRIVFVVCYRSWWLPIVWGTIVLKGKCIFNIREVAKLLMRNLTMQYKFQENISLKLMVWCQVKFFLDIWKHGGFALRISECHLYELNINHSGLSFFVSKFSNLSYYIHTLKSYYSVLRSCICCGGILLSRFEVSAR